MNLRTVALIGAGTLGGIIADGICSGAAGNWKLVGVTDVSKDAGLALSHKHNCPYYADVQQLIDLQPDLIVECAVASVLKEWAPVILGSRIDMIALSAGALADVDFKEQVSDICRKSGAVLHIPSGAVGGFDVLAAAAAAGDYDLVISNLKPPEGLTGAPGLDGITLSNTEKQLIFSGTPEEAISAFPKNVNVAVATAAAAGVKNVCVEVWSVPGLPLNTHEIRMNGEFGEALMSFASRPSKTNPKSSALAGYSVISLLLKLDSPIQYE